MTKYIAEIGLNHLGDETLAAKTLDILLQSGIDAVTFQIREKAFYDDPAPERRPLSDGFYRGCSQKVRATGKEFGIATCDADVVPRLASMVDFWKSLSWDLTNAHLIDAMVASGKQLYMSTGVSSMDDIAAAARRYASAVLIQTQLSQEISDVNVMAIKTIADRTNRKVAFGLHCQNHDVIKLAITLRPAAVFFYVKEVGLQMYFDDGHAIIREKVAEHVANWRELESAVGNGEKHAAKRPDWVIITDENENG
jgi:N,N'-diacetyllegionaminate synthase